MVEVLLATVIASFIMLAVWGVYMMSWQWWAETSPRIDLERAARMALLSVIEGSIDTNAGTYTIGATTYTRRNGIAWATAKPTIAFDASVPPIPYKIKYKLAPDSGNIREFYYGTYSGNGYVFYKNAAAGSIGTKIDSTKGITGIRFSRLVNRYGVEQDNIIQVVVTAEKSLYGTRKANPYIVKVVYTDTIYLRNAL